MGVGLYAFPSFANRAARAGYRKKRGFAPPVEVRVFALSPSMGLRFVDCLKTETVEVANGLKTFGARVWSLDLKTGENKIIAEAPRPEVATPSSEPRFIMPRKARWVA